MSDAPPPDDQRLLFDVCDLPIVTLLPAEPAVKPCEYPVWTNRLGVDNSVIQRILRHSTVATKLGSPAHRGRNSARSAVNKRIGLFSPKSGNGQSLFSI